MLLQVLDKEHLIRTGMVEQIKREISILKQASWRCVVCRGRGEWWCTHGAAASPASQLQPRALAAAGVRHPALIA